MSISIIVARLFAAELNRNINEFGIVGVSFSRVGANPISGQQPNFEFGFNDTGFGALTASSYVRRSDYNSLGSDESTARELDGQAECITLNLSSYPSLREVTNAQKIAASLDRKVKKLQDIEGKAKSFSDYLLYAFHALKVTHIYAESWSESQGKSSWTMYKKSDVKMLVAAYVGELATQMNWKT
jgi:hypothetical protein